MAWLSGNRLKDLWFGWEVGEQGFGLKGRLYRTMSKGLCIGQLNPVLGLMGLLSNARFSSLGFWAADLGFKAKGMA